MSKHKVTLYRTSDIYFAAYLNAVDIRMVTTEEGQGGNGARKLVFVFDVGEVDISRIKSSYFSGHATVVARALIDNIKALKSMVYT